MSIGLDFARPITPSILSPAQSKTGENLFFELMTQDQDKNRDPAEESASPQEFIAKIYKTLQIKADSDPAVKVECRFAKGPIQNTEIIKRYNNADRQPDRYTTLDQATLAIRDDGFSIQFVGRGRNKFASIPQIQNIGNRVTPFNKSPEKQSPTNIDPPDTFTYTMELTYNNKGTATITLTACNQKESPSYTYSMTRLQIMPHKTFTHGKYEFRSNDPNKKGRLYSISTRNPTIIASDTNRIWGTEFRYNINPVYSLRSFFQHFTESDHFPHPDMILFTTKSGVPQPAYRSLPSEQQSKLSS